MKPGKENSTTTAPVKPRLRSRRRRIVFPLVCILLGLVCGVLLVEISLRLFPPRDFISKRLLLDAGNRSVSYQCYSSNPHGEFQPLPNLRSRYWKFYDFSVPMVELPLEDIRLTPYCVDMSTSGQGLRDRLYDFNRPEGELRIAGIGDSFAAGEGVPLERSLFKQMEQLLGENDSVLNAGVPGLSTKDEVAMLGPLVESFHCQRAIVVFLPNDISLTPELNQKQVYINDLINIRDRNFAHYKQTSSVFKRSRLFSMIKARLEMSRVERENVQWYLDSYDERFNAENLRKFKQDLKRMAEVENCQVVFVMYPLLIGFEDGYPLQSIHDLVGQLARDAGLPTLDLAPYFDGRKTSDFWAHPKDHHPNGNAHRIAAQAIVNWLKKNVPGFLKLNAEETPND